MINVLCDSIGVHSCAFWTEHHIYCGLVLVCICLRCRHIDIDDFKLIGVKSDVSNADLSFVSLAEIYNSSSLGIAIILFNTMNHLG